MKMNKWDQLFVVILGMATLIGVLFALYAIFTEK